MPTPADLADPTYRKALEDVEKLIDAGDFSGASRTCAETYLLVLDKHPELMPTPVPPGGAGTPGFAAARNDRAVRWPPTGGLTVDFDALNKPSLNFAKQRFSLSEALGYFEFMMNLVWNLQNQRQL